MSDTSWNDIIYLTILANVLSADEEFIEKIKKIHIYESFFYSSLGIPIPQDLKILGNEKYKKFRDEIDEYNKDFINQNGCDKYNPHTEYKEYYLGLNEIIKKYELIKLNELQNNLVDSFINFRIGVESLNE